MPVESKNIQSEILINGKEINDFPILNITDISLHFSINDFNGDFVTPLNILNQFLTEKQIKIENQTCIHLCHKKDLGNNNSLYYTLKKMFPNNKFFGGILLDLIVEK